jgi:hypothetical protein
VYRIIQTDHRFPGIEAQCLQSQAAFEQLGYETMIIDIRSDARSFVSVLIDVLERRPDVRFFMIGFGDLYYSKIAMPTAKSVETTMRSLQLDYLRCDARPKGRGTFGSQALGGIKLLSGKQDYVYSTVNSVFSRSLIADLHKLGCESAWDIESVSAPVSKAGVLAGRRCHYQNLIVKGELDPVAIAQTPLGLSVPRAVIRYVRKVIRDAVTNG